MNAVDFFSKIIEMLQIIWLRLYQFNVQMGESDFAILSLRDDNLICVIVCVLIVTLFGLNSTSNFEWDNPTKLIPTSKDQIGLLNVILYAAAIFSLHPFYKILAYFLAQWFKLPGSYLQLQVTGSYINPISLMIVGVTIANTRFEKKDRQSFFLILMVFLSPMLLCVQQTSDLTKTFGVRVACVVGLAILSCFLCTKAKKRDMFLVTFYFYLYWILGKFFMMYGFAGSAADSNFLQVNDFLYAFRQYLSGISVDLMLELLLLIILMGLVRLLVNNKTKGLKTEVIGIALFAALLAISLYLGEVTPMRGAETVTYDFFHRVATELTSQAQEAGEYKAVFASINTDDKQGKIFSSLGFFKPNEIMDQMDADSFVEAFNRDYITQTYGTGLKNIAEEIYDTPDYEEYFSQLSVLSVTPGRHSAVVVLDLDGKYEQLALGVALCSPSADLSDVAPTILFDWDQNSKAESADGLESADSSNYADEVFNYLQERVHAASISITDAEKESLLYYKELLSNSSPEKLNLKVSGVNKLKITLYSEYDQYITAALYRMTAFAAGHEEEAEQFLESEWNSKSLLIEAYRQIGNSVEGGQGWFRITSSSANIRSGPGKTNAKVSSGHKGDLFEATGYSEDVGGTTWYEIYLDKEHTSTGWASEKVMQAVDE